MPSRLEGIQPQPDNGKFDPAEWIGLQNTRAIIRAERSVMLERLRLQLRNIDPLLEQQDGVCLFKKCLDEIVYQVLICNSLAPGSTVFCVNRIREAPDTEGGSVNDGIIEMTDVTLPQQGKLLAFETDVLGAQEVVSRAPEVATFLIHQGEEVFLHGALAGSPLEPIPAETPADVQLNGFVYAVLSQVLRVCNPETLVRQVRSTNF